MALTLAPLLLLLLVHLAALLPLGNASEATCLNFTTCEYPYVVVLDAGSTKTKVNVFRFRRHPGTGSKVHLLSEGKDKAKPGLASFANYPQRIHCSLRPLIQFATSRIPAESQAETPIVLAATAGVRALSLDRVRAVVRATAASLRRTPFRVHDSISDQALAMLLSGKEEASFAWVGVNLLMGTFDTANVSVSYGVLELGGGSTQIAAASSDMRAPDRSRSFTVEHKYWIQSANFPLHLNSYLGLGKSAVTLKMFGYNEKTNLTTYTSPCLHPEVGKPKFHFDSVSINVSADPTILSSDRWSVCHAKAQDIVKKFHVQQAPKSAMYIAVGGYYYTILALSKLTLPDGTKISPESVSLQRITLAAQQACKEPHRRGKFAIYLCIDAAYIVALLRDGYGFTDEQSFLAKNSHDKHSLGWPVGLAATYVKEPCFIGTPAVGFFEKRRAAGAAK